MRLVNARGYEVKFYLEPWGDEYPMPAGTSLGLLIRGPEDHALEVILADDSIELWASTGCVVAVFRQGQQLGPGVDQRPPVPEYPPPTEGHAGKTPNPFNEPAGGQEI